VARLADPADARKSRLTLTAKGRRINGSRAGTVEAAIARALDAASPRDVRSARALLEHIAQNLEVSPRRAAVRRVPRQENP
jgi:DNA-binding MarR family transcriptional regulator